jgi:hypothetical protein
MFPSSQQKITDQNFNVAMAFEPDRAAAFCQFVDYNWSPQAAKFRDLTAPPWGDQQPTSRAGEENNLATPADNAIGSLLFSSSA